MDNFLFAKAITFIKDGKPVNHNELKENEEYSLIINIRTSKDRDFPQLKIKPIPQIKIKSIVVSTDEKNLSNNYTLKYLSKFRSYCKSLELISVSLNYKDRLSDDTALYLNENIKANIEKIANAFPQATTAIVEADTIKDRLHACTLKGLAENQLLITDDKIEFVKDKIAKLADLIKSKTDSPYEQHLLAVHFISQYIYNDNPDIYNASRSLYSILSTNAKYIVCVGYARLYSAIMKELGFDAGLISVDGHLRSKVVIQDEKYDVNGTYAVDPTYLARYKEDAKPKFKISKFMHLSLKSLYKKYIGENFKTPLEEEEDRTLAIKKINFALQNFNFTTVRDILKYLEAEHLESFNPYWLYFIADINESYKDESISIDDETKKSILEKINNTYGKNENPILLDFAKKPKKERLKLINQLIATIKRKFKDFLLSEPNEDKNALLSDSITQSIEVLHLPPRLYDLVADITFEKVKDFNLEEQLNKIDRKLTDHVITNKYLTFPMTVQLRLTRLKELQNVIDGINLKPLTDNFTRYSDFKFRKVFNATTEISDETMLRGMQAIKKLITEEDYLLFVQDLSDLQDDSTLSAD